MAFPINRYSFTLLFIIVISFIACKKDTADNQSTTPAPSPQPNTPVTDNSYKIDGLKDITLKSIDSGVIALKVIPNNSEEKKVTLSVIDLPQNVKAAFSNNGNVIPYNTDLTIRTGGAKPGNYPITVTAKSSTGNTINKYTATLTILNTDSQDCINFFAKAASSGGLLNTYTVANDSIGFSIGSPPQVKLGGYSGQIQNAIIGNLILEYNTTPAIQYIYHSGIRAILQIDCNKGTLYMDEPYIVGSPGAYSVKGSGTFDYFSKTYEFKYTSTGKVAQTFILRGKLKL